MATRRWFFFIFSATLASCACSASGQSTPLLIITNRTLVDNQFIFGRNAASPPTLSKRVIDTTHRSVFGLSPTDSVIKASTNIRGGIMTGSPELDFNAGAQTITRDGGSWITDGFAVAQYVFVKGSTHNDGIVRGWITNVNSTVMTLNAVLVNENDAAGVVVRGGDRFVTVENFGNAPIYDGRRANTSNITIDGNNPTMPDFLFASPTEINLSPWGSTYTADGIALDGQLATAQNVLVHHCRGVGIAHQQGDGRVFDSEIFHCHTGVRVPSSDMEVRRCRIFGCRDSCLFLALGAGNIQSTDNHCYGARIACYNEGAFPYRATGDTYADAWIGYFGSVHAIRTVLNNMLFQHNTTRDCVFSNFGCCLEASYVEVMRDVEDFNQLLPPAPLVPTYLPQKVGVEITGHNCSIRGGLIELTDFKHPTEHEFTGKGAEAIRISGDGHNCVIETQLLDRDSVTDTVNGSVGVHIIGARIGLKIDCVIAGFEGIGDRMLKFTGTGNNSQGLDITLRGDFANDITNMTPSETTGVEKYIDIAAGTWTGRIKFIDTGSGATRTLTPGGAY